MTEAEWLGAVDPGPMLKFLREKASDRKLRLFGVGCCRRIWHLLTDPRSRAAVEVAERFADGWASDGERREASSGANDAVEALRADGPTSYYAACAAEDLVYSERLGMSDVRSALFTGQWEAEAQVVLLRDIFPFHPVTFLPEWRTSTVLALAQQMYDSRDFSAMPILADALGDAGCEDEAVLTHCRSSGPHVCGCWCVDACLGKS